MSALLAPISWLEETEARPARGRLRMVPPAPARLARFPFILVLIGVFAVGMAGLLLLNTTLQNQAFQARRLDREATALAYQQAALESQIEQFGGAAELARRASALGMRPNTQPAFLILPGGKVVGDARRVTGGEAPDLIVKTPAELAAERAAAQAKREAKAAAAAAKAKAAEEQRKQKAAATAKKKAAAEAKKKLPAGHN
jgi:hypothetical protein